MKDIMSSETPAIKQLTVRCTEEFWERVGIAARKGRISVQGFLIEAAEREMARREQELARPREGTAA